MALALAGMLAAVDEPPAVGRYSTTMPSSGSSHDESTVVVDGTRSSGDASSDPSDAARAGARLGRYLVIDELGRGGMGLVLRAYDPKLQREVALKRLRTHALDESSQARLVREARAMARLNHPNVVAVYDVELALDDPESGVVVVMEYVAGGTLRQWLEDAPRSWPAIVEAFVAAGRGLAVAHDEGLLHRDFKLDNVLVGTDGRVRVTDFGLARTSATQSSRDVVDIASFDDVLSRDDSVSLELTQAGTVMGTPPYMAPEQTEGAELDPRADQYAFCVALWRALTQRWPFEGRGRALLQAKLAGPPTWPSDVAVPRHVVDALRRGLSPDRSARWPSLPALLAELGRDPSRTRRRTLALAIVALAGMGAWGLQHVQRARALGMCAIEGQSIADTWNERRAGEIAAAFETTNVAYAADTWGRTRERLEQYAHDWQAIRTRVCERANVEHAWSDALALASHACLDEHRDELQALLQQLADPDATTVQKAVAASASLPLSNACADENQLRQRAEPPSDPQAREHLRVLRARLADVSAAIATGRYEPALRDAQAVLVDATQSSWPPLVAEARYAVGNAHEKLGQYEDAQRELQDAFFAAGAAGRDDLALLASRSLVFVVGHRLARHDEGLRWGRVAQMLTQRQGRSDDLVTAGLHDALGAVHNDRGDHDEAIALHERALAIRQTVLGAEHPDVAGSLNYLGITHAERGDHARSLQVLERALAILQKNLGPDHPDLAMATNNLGNARFVAGDYTEALELYDAARRIRERALGPEHLDVAASLLNVANVHKTRQQYAQALELYEKALSIREKALGSDHPEVAAVISNLGTVHAGQREHAKALELHERALAIMERAHGPEHPWVAASLNNLATVYSDIGEHGKALELHERALAIREKALGPEHPEVALSLNNIGSVLSERNEHAKALELQERALAIWEKTLGPEHPSFAVSLHNLANARWARGDYAQSIEDFERALAIRERCGATPPELAVTRFALARALWDGGSDRARAIELATTARDAYGTDDEAAIAEVDAWLANTGLDKRAR